MLSGFSEMSGRNWFVVQTKPNAWKIAARNLARQEFDVFVPSVKHTQQWRGKTQLVCRPAFQGYIFVRFDPDSSPWRAINSTFGVSRLVAFGGGVVPTMVPPAFILELCARCDEDGVLQTEQCNFKPGDKVRVEEGPFADIVAEVTKMGTQQRIWVLMEVMGRPTAVQLSSASVTGVAA